MDEMTRILAEAACRRLIDEYCHLVDHGQASRVADQFIDDGVWKTAEYQATGRAAIGQMFKAREQNVGRRSRHLCCNTLIDALDENRATAVSYLTLYRSDGEPDRGNPPVEPPAAIGEYRDEFVKTPLGWRFRSRECVVSFGTLGG